MKWLAVAVVAGVVGWAVWWTVVPADHADGQGILSIGSDGFALIDPGVYSLGIQPCTVEGARTVVHEVGLEETSGDVTLLGVMERRLPTGSSGVGAVAGFPPAESELTDAEWTDFERMVVDHDCSDVLGSRPELLVGVEFGPDGGIIGGLTVRYRSGLRLREDHAVFEVVLCGPAVTGLHRLCGG